MPKRILELKYVPESDPSHPDCKLPVRGEADVWMRLVRKFGFAKGMKLFGIWMAFINGHEVERILGQRELSDIAAAFKACNLIPDDVYPRDVSNWFFNVGVEGGKIAGAVVTPPNDSTKAAES